MEGSESPEMTGAVSPVDESGSAATARSPADDSERGQAPREGGPSFNREEMVKRFDTDGDGQLNEEERTAMRQQFGGGQRGRTNAPPEGT
jgi:hypothetical protein